MGTAFFVKTIFRERDNKRWEAAARIYHILLLFIPWACGYLWMTLPFIISLIRTDCILIFENSANDLSSFL